jgi:hypothetical protein
MVNTTYEPNMIGISTLEGDLGHHILRMEEKTQESPMEPPQLKRGGGRKRKKSGGLLCTPVRPDHST